MDTATLVSFLSASILLTLAPGPDILFVLAKSLSQGPKAGLSVALGLVTGTFIHTALAALGISLLIRESAVAFSCVKWAGVAYLTFLGIQALRHLNDALPSNASDDSIPRSKNARGLYLTGVFMAALNPKLIIFFLAFLPMFIPENGSNACSQMLVLGMIFSAQALIIFSIVSVLSGTLSRTLRQRPGISRFLNAATALILFGIAASVAFISTGPEI